MVLSKGNFRKASAKNLEMVIAERSGETRVGMGFAERVLDYIASVSDSDAAPSGDDQAGAADSARHARPATDAGAPPCKKKKVTHEPRAGHESTARETEPEAPEAIQDRNRDSSLSHISQTPSMST